jgi:cytochrome c
MKVLRRIALLNVVLLGCVGAALAQQGNAEEGENVFKKCRTSHDIGKGAKSKVGPPLNNVVGRKAASVDGFAYSTDMKALGAKGFVWNEENLKRYLGNV